MSFRAITIGIAALVWAVPVAAQQRGTVEFGAFAALGSFDNSLSLKHGFGGGGRIGAFLDPRWSIEAELGEMKVTRPSGLKDVNMGILSTRLTAVPIKSGALSILLGVGAGVGTETNFLHSYGVNALVGAKIALGNEAALRIDAQQDWLANYSYKAYQRVSVGLSLYRELFRTVRSDTVRVPGPAAVCERCVQRADSVSAAETRRLRDRDAELRALRDSLSRAPRNPPPPARRELMTLRGAHFEFDKSILTAAAKDTLQQAVTILKEHPDSRVEIQGHTDSVGSDQYNQALSERRANSVKTYLGSQGISESRIATRGFGESQPIASNSTAAGRAENRRVVIIEVP